MLSEEEINKYLNKHPDKKEQAYQVKDKLESYGVDTNAVESGISKYMQKHKKGISQDQLVDDFKNAINNASRNIRKNKVKIDIDKTDIKGTGPKGSQINKLIQLILTIVNLPKRFLFLSKSIGEATAGLVLSIGGLGQSIKLGAEDVYMLVVAIFNIIIKYFLCIISFIMTSIAGCSLLHVITLIVLIIKMALLTVANFIETNFGHNISEPIETAFEYIKWPDPIYQICYTCFGKKRKLRDVLIDVRVIEDIGNKLTYDFNNRMPRYMRPGAPLGKMAMKSLKTAIAK